jgi:NTE family protein
MDHDHTNLTTDLLRMVPPELREHLLPAYVRRVIERGQVLVTRGDPSESMFLVVSGRFNVHFSLDAPPFAEVGVGEPIGEVGFFAKTPRSATVVAARDAIVLEIDRTSFSEIASKAPGIYEAALASMAQRLAARTARLAPETRGALPRTVALVGAGDSDIAGTFAARLERTMARMGIKAMFVSEKDIPGEARDPAGAEFSEWLNAQEFNNDLLVYVADPDLSAWSRKAVRQADELIIVVPPDSAPPPGQVETFAFAVHPPSHRRLVLLHTARAGGVTGTAAVLAPREAAMHHHVAPSDDEDVESVCRFVTGKAIGFVAGAGGAFGPAHVGIFQAFQERGIKFDIVGGTSVGAAIMAAFAFLSTPQQITDAMHDIFIESRGFRRPTLPFYALLDHVAFDAALKRQYCGYNIEDTWRAFFSVSTDLSANAPFVHRRGPLWRAVRGSSALPGILPPVYQDGHMLVDGGLVELVPLHTMRTIKEGPNVVVHFGLRSLELFDVEYDAIPGAWQLITSLLRPGGRKALPRAPGPIEVLRRSMVSNQRLDLLAPGPKDLVMKPPIFAGSSFMDWSKYRDVYEAAYRWALQYIDELAAKDDPVLLAMKQASGQ